MAQSIRNIVSEINESLKGVFKGSKIYGIATLVEREGKGLPVADEQAVSFDDSYAMQLYHRVQGANIAYTTGYGNTQNAINTYQASMFVFNNEKITNLKTDEIAMIIQSALSVHNITSVRILPTQIILNSQQVFATEYRGIPYALNEYQSLMQINYTVEITFKGLCFNLCPGDFSKCPN